MLILRNTQGSVSAKRDSGVRVFGIDSIFIMKFWMILLKEFSRIDISPPCAVINLQKKYQFFIIIVAHLLQIIKCFKKRLYE